MKRYLVKMALAVICVMSIASCIDEDMSDCGNDYRIDYTVRLHTNMRTEIATELTTETEQAFGEKLKEALANVFAERACDIDLSFYADGQLAHHEVHEVDASATSFSIYLPVADYRHLALANVAAEPIVSLVGQDAVGSLAIEQSATDTVATHSVGLFSARLPMLVEDGIDQTFHVNLYMQNCASALVLDLNGQQPTQLEAFINGTATGFSVSDSLYDHSRPIVVRTERLEEGDLVGFYAAAFPTPETTRAETSEGLWNIVLLVDMPDGRRVTNTLSISDPLRAGNLRIVKAKLNADGSVEPKDESVSVSVKLTWNSGGEHDVEM